MDRQKVVGVVLLGLIGLYFALQGREKPPSPSRPVPAPEEKRVEEGGKCLARVWTATLGYQEVRLQVEGQAWAIRLSWPGGGLQVETPKVCSGGECKVPIPPGVRPVEVQVDACPSLRLGE
ncbi:hypothetical protein [Thermus sp.]|jgi:hypothetical protein|uniref:hypothetical protein n=1 Tax=Thermus sp. TaxID=275 RepID=UPI0032202A2A